MDFLEQDIINYCKEFSSEEDNILAELARETKYKILMPRMMSGHLVGTFLEFISKIKQPQHILEIGTYTGYSAICLAKGLKKSGSLHTIEINPELKKIASKYFQKAKLAEKIHLHIGNGLDIIPTLNLKFDIVFIDADKKNYCSYYELALKKINRGGYIVIDNVLWSGKVISKAKENDFETREIQKLNTMIKNDTRVHNVLLPLRDGLMLCEVL